MPDREGAGATPVTLSTNIVDVSGCSLRQYWNLKSHMQAASVLATAHYPETLDRIFIVGAPAFFTTVWAWIKRWFDPATVAKIFILAPADVRPTLEAFIAPENIPARYGGGLAFDWLDPPNLDPRLAERVRWPADARASFPKGPLFWRPVSGDPDKLECVATGSSGGAVRRHVACTIKRCCFPAPVDVGAGEHATARTSGVAAASRPTETEVGQPSAGEAIGAPAAQAEAEAKSVMEQANMNGHATAATKDGKALATSAAMEPESAGATAGEKVDSSHLEESVPSVTAIAA